MSPVIAKPISLEAARSSVKSAEDCARSASEQLADTEAQLVEAANRFPISASAQARFVELHTKRAALADLLGRVSATLPALRAAMRDAEAYEAAAPARAKAQADAARRAELAGYPENAETQLLAVLDARRVEVQPHRRDILITTDMVRDKLLPGVRLGEVGEPYFVITHEAEARQFFEANTRAFAAGSVADTIEDAAGRSSRDHRISRRLRKPADTGHPLLKQEDAMDRNDQHHDRRKNLVRLSDAEKVMAISLIRRRGATPQDISLAFGVSSSVAHALWRKARHGLQHEVMA